MSRNYEKKAPSVTQIVSLIDKPGLRWWYGHEGWEKCEQIKEESSASGRNVHAAIDLFLKGTYFEEAAKGLTEIEKASFSKFTSWIVEEKLKAIECELSLHSAKYEFNGTFDFLGTRSGKLKLWLGDWKTSKSLHPKDHKYQMGGYSVLIKECLGKNVTHGFVKRVGLNGTTDLMETDELKVYREKFLNLRTAYFDWFNK